jgi:hypothetical protein
MSEHEGALFDVVRILGTTVLELGADAKILSDRLNAARTAAEAQGNRHGAETIRFLIGALFPTPEPTPRPTLRVI